MKAPRGHPRLLITVAVLLSVVVCGMVAWLGWRHRGEHWSVEEHRERVRTARIDLGRGFLHLLLDQAPNDPFDRAAGIVLIRQAVATIGREAAAWTGLPGQADDEFHAAAAAFERALAAWRAAGFDDPRTAVEVRVAHAGLDLAAARLDGILEAAFMRAVRLTDLRFAWATGVAGVLLAAICLIVVRALRRLEATRRELATSEERFREVSASFTDIAYSCHRAPDGGHAIEWITGRVGPILGFTAEEVIASGGWAALVVPEDRERFAAGVAGLPPGGDGRCELRLRRRDGSHAWLASWCRCVEGGTRGAPARLFGVFVDISERKAAEEKARVAEDESRRLLAQAEATRRALLSVVEDQKRAETALAESLERYEQANRVTFDVLWDWDIAADTVTRNRNFPLVFGYDAATFPATIEAWYERLHPDDRGRVRDSLADALESTRDSWSDHYRFRCQDGHWADIEDRAAISRDPDGRPVRVIGAMQDITERRKAEEELRRLSMAVEQSSAMVVISDAAGRIEYVNPRFTTVTGWTLEEARGRDAGFLAVKDRATDDHRVIWSTISAGREWHGEFHNRRKDGTPFWEQATIAPMRDSSGAITHYIAVKEDITAHKDLEAQLLQAQKMESVGRLAGGVAHDFNNMLQVIQSYTEIALGKGGATGPLAGYLLQIREAARRSADLTGQLLAFARKQAASPRVIDLNEAVEGTLKLLRRLIGEDIELSWTPGPDLWAVHVDPSQVDQVLANLAVNARDAITGTGRLAIATRNVTRDAAYCTLHQGCVPGEYVLLTVGDDGCGMPPEVLAHLFEPFFTTKGVGKGTGLGTATVYGIVRQNNGFIDVESAPGRGTTFRIHLPRARVKEVRPPTGEAPVDLPRGAETVLLVEDEAAILELGRQLLGELGYTVLAAGDPREALRLAGGHPGSIDLLVTDVVMPGMNGRELADALAADRAGLRCLYLSGYTADVIAKQGVIEGGLRFLQKPFSFEQLARSVRAALEDDPGRGP